MKRLFLPGSPYRQRARLIAHIWALLIFIGCFTPGHELPELSVPFFDKWTHFIAFGVLTFLWLCAWPAYTRLQLISFFFLATIMGGVIEVGQGALTSLGRSMELMDGVADAVGAVLGILTFVAAAGIVRKTPTPEGE